MHYAINRSNEELCTKSYTHLGLFNLVLLEGNMNNFLSEIPLKFEYIVPVTPKRLPINIQLGTTLISLLDGRVYSTAHQYQCFCV